MSRILITGGAGFIGSHLAHNLVDHGHDVRVLDDLHEQVHRSQARPIPLPEEAEHVRGDVRDAARVREALQDVDAVYHFAASVGVGQSMYEIQRYVENNSVGTAVLMEALAGRDLDRLVIASSMSVYGEGLYRDADGNPVMDAHRRPQDLRQGVFEPLDSLGRPLFPQPTPETKTPQLESVYALTKYDQERLGLMLGQSYGIPTTALRFFNVYGPGQTLGNPYTGVLAIFATRILNDNPPLVFEDGEQRRDFVHVHDVVNACRAALSAPEAVDQTINVGSGRPITIKRLVEEILETMDRNDIHPEITGRARLGDVRHCFADIDRARGLLGYRPRVSLQEGLAHMMDWLKSQHASDPTHAHMERLQRKGLVA